MMRLTFRIGTSLLVYKHGTNDKMDIMDVRTYKNGKNDKMDK